MQKSYLRKRRGKVYPRNLLRLAADRFFCVPSKPPSHTRLLLRHPGKEIVLARFAAKPQPPILVADKTKLSSAICAAVLELGHEILPPR